MKRDDGDVVDPWSRQTMAYLTACVPPFQTIWGRLTPSWGNVRDDKGTLLGGVSASQGELLVASHCSLLVHCKFQDFLEKTEHCKEGETMMIKIENYFAILNQICLKYDCARCFHRDCDRVAGYYFWVNVPDLRILTRWRKRKKIVSFFALTP